MNRVKWSDPSAFTLSYYRSPGFKQKKLDVYAARASRLHPLVGDWICAAPILSVVLNDERYYQGLFDLASARGRLVDAMRVCHLPTPMRKQTPADADAWHRWTGWRATFAEMPDSELAQLLARISGSDREAWMSRLNLAVKLRPPRSDFGDYARWAVRTSAAHDRDKIYNATHFMKENDYDLSWTIGQFDRAHAAWVERMRATWAIQREAARAGDAIKQAKRREQLEKILDEPVDYAPFPLTAKVGVGHATALDTPRKLLDEGHKMRHCVGGEQFRSAMRKRQALYFHLEAGAERSTLEIQRRGDKFMIGQHCGPCNQRPSPALQDTATRLLGHVIKANTSEEITKGGVK